MYLKTEKKKKHHYCQLNFIYLFIYRDTGVWNSIFIIKKCNSQTRDILVGMNQNFYPSRISVNRSFLGWEVPRLSARNSKI